MATGPYNESFFAMHEAGARILGLLATIALLVELVHSSQRGGRWLRQWGLAGGVCAVESTTTWGSTAIASIAKPCCSICAVLHLRHDLKQPLKLDAGSIWRHAWKWRSICPSSVRKRSWRRWWCWRPWCCFPRPFPIKGARTTLTQAQYWQAIFANHDYVVVDALRERLWCHKDVTPWDPPEHAVVRRSPAVGGLSGAGRDLPADGRKPAALAGASRALRAVARARFSRI